MNKAGRGSNMDLSEYLQRFNKGDKLAHLDINQVIAAAKDGQTSAMEALLVRNIGLVLGEARRYTQDSAALPDYMEEGFMGVMRAARTFDPSLGHQFSTYAVSWIRHYISAMHMAQSSAVYVPVNTRKEVRKAHAVYQKHFDACGDMVLAVKNAAAEMGVPAKRVKSLINLGRVSRSMEDRGADGEGASLSESLEDEGMISPEEQAAIQEQEAVLSTVLHLLSEKERNVVPRHFFHGVSLAELGREANQSRQQVQAVASRALAKMKQHMASMGMHRYAS